MDVELKELESSRTLGEIFFNYWAKHKCPNHNMCMRVLILDGQLKASHSICGLSRGVLGGESIQLAELDKAIHLGCRDGCAKGSRFCKVHGPILEINGVGTAAAAAAPAPAAPAAPAAEKGRGIKAAGVKKRAPPAEAAHGSKVWKSVFENR